jgi:serine O-acetyltransferase
MSLFELYMEDLKTHQGKILEQGLWALTVHRFGSWKADIQWAIFRWPLSLLFNIGSKLVEWSCGITIDPVVRMGRRVHLWHHSGIVLAARSIGNDVHIRQNTTMGTAHTYQNDDRPVIEDRVDIGCGVCILGNVTVGHDSVIGANAVVTKDIPPYSVAAGVPARVIKRQPGGG